MEILSEPSVLSLDQICNFLILRNYFEQLFLVILNLNSVGFGGGLGIEITFLILAIRSEGHALQ